LPNILEDVAVGAGESITESLKKTFESPNMQRAMSILGQKSGDVRADKAVRKKAADGIMDQMPVIKMVLDKIGLSPLEGLQLMNDPTFGPMIQNFIGNIGKGKGEPNRPGQGVM